MIFTPGLFGTHWLPRDVHELLYANGWRDPITMVKMNATVTGESDRYEGAIGKVNSNGSQDWGMFQLNSYHWSDFADSEVEFHDIAIDARKAAPIARKLFDKAKAAGGTGFEPWYAYGGKHYLESLDECCRGLANFASLRIEGKLVL